MEGLFHRLTFLETLRMVPLRFSMAFVVARDLRSNSELFRKAEFSWAHAQYANVEWPSFDARDDLTKITARSLVNQRCS